MFAGEDPSAQDFRFVFGSLNEVQRLATPDLDSQAADKLAGAVAAAKQQILQALDASGIENAEAALADLTPTADASQIQAEYDSAKAEREAAIKAKAEQAAAAEQAEDDWYRQYPWTEFLQSSEPTGGASEEGIGWETWLLSGFRDDALPSFQSQRKGPDASGQSPALPAADAGEKPSPGQSPPDPKKHTHMQSWLDSDENS